MVTRQIEIDEESDRILDRLAQDFGGDGGRALSELLHTREAVEEFMDVCETAHNGILLTQKNRAETGAANTFTPREEIKRRHNL